MTTKYYAILTTLGAGKLANAAALGTKLQITHMALGDGGGVLPTPNASQTALVGEKRRAPLNALSIDAANSSQIIAEQVIPESEGGWWIREIGLFDADGVLIAVANCAETYKPLLQEGSGRTQTVRMILIVNSTDAVTLKIDPAVVLATRKYVDDAVIEVKSYADSMMSQHLLAAEPHQQYAPKFSPTFTGKPKAPTPATGTNNNELANTAFVQSAIAALVASSPAALDTLSELAAALNNDPNFATTITNTLALKAPLASPALSGTPTAPTPGQAVNNTQIATTAFTQALVSALNTTLTNTLALKAPLASPALSGTPTAPTAVQTTNNTQLATTAFVKAALAGLVDSSPAALDTLKELAAALGNDPNFATTMTNALAGKMDISKNGADISSVAVFLQNIGVGEGAKLPAVSVSTTGGLLVKIPFFTPAKAVNYLVIQMATITPVALANGQVLTHSFPVAYDSEPWAILSGTVGIIASSGADEGMELMAVAETGVKIVSHWNSRPASYAPIRLLSVGVKANA